MSIFELCIAERTGLREDQEALTTSFFAKNATVLVTERLIAEMKEYAIQQGRRNLRVCLHQDRSALCHEMIILELRESYYPPHKHLKKQESRHIIEGETAIFVFSEDGEVQDHTVLGARGNLIYRVAANCYHYGVPLTDVVIYHETKPGPFIPDGDSLFPPWAPDRTDLAAGRAYTQNLLSTLPKR